MALLPPPSTAPQAALWFRSRQTVLRKWKQKFPRPHRGRGLGRENSAAVAGTPGTAPEGGERSCRPCRRLSPPARGVSLTQGLGQTHTLHGLVFVFLSITLRNIAILRSETTRTLRSADGTWVSQCLRRLWAATDGSADLQRFRTARLSSQPSVTADTAFALSHSANPCEHCTSIRSFVLCPLRTHSRLASSQCPQHTREGTAPVQRLRRRMSLTTPRCHRF